MTTQRDVEPWAPQLPGCHGHCQQGRRPCLSPEECMPDSQAFSRWGCMTVIALTLVCWTVVILVGVVIASML